jgi:hypothetical protein
MAQKTQN